jgi:hypothetical protein
MGGVKKVFKSRKFCGNRHNKKNFDVVSQGLGLETVVDVADSNLALDPGCSSGLGLGLENNGTTPPSASRRKLSTFEEKYEEYNDCDLPEDQQKSGYVLMNIQSLKDFFAAATVCKHCKKSVELPENFEKRSGLSCELSLTCNCAKASVFKTSPKLQSGFSEVNLRFVYALRSIGVGQQSAKLFCAIMDLPQPPSRFSNYIPPISKATNDVATKSMVAAAEELLVINDNDKNTAVAIDGSWQKPGHTSLNGVVTATSMDTGKVLDVVCLSKYCHSCTANKNKDTEHKDFHSPVCVANYQGSSGGMEVQGALAIFHRSMETRGLRYLQYLGDGDSKGFMKVNESKPYGSEHLVEKLECVGHVQKRMGSRLRKLKKTLSGTKLDDGKSLGGRNRLTDSQIDLIQNYYGLAVRRNTNSLSDMKQAVWAVYFHKLSTDATPQHGLCPKGELSWCKYNRAQVTGKIYEHNSSLPVAVMNKIKPIFKDLSNDNLLSKCLHGKTQNPNECFNSTIWKRVPKKTFVGLETMQIGVEDAVVVFNDGNMGRVKILEALGMKPGFNTLKQLRAFDSVRVAKADQVALEMTKSARTARRNAKRRLEESHEDPDNPEYEAGAY